MAENQPGGKPYLPHWGMAVDIDRCIGCQACVVACQAENNIPLNTADIMQQRRAIEWIRIERYWEGEYPEVKARFIPVMCQHCTNAPCEPVCPVYAPYHTPEGLNAQIYNRCIGTRYCANNCPWHARFFNFWERPWPDPLNEQLNPDVTVRSKGIMEKCTMCIQRIRRATRAAGSARTDRKVPDGSFNTACAQTCPTDALVFGDLNDPESRVHKLTEDPRRYSLLGYLGTEPGVFYLEAVDPNYKEERAAGGSQQPGGGAT